MYKTYQLVTYLLIKYNFCYSCLVSSSKQYIFEQSVSVSTSMEIYETTSSQTLSYLSQKTQRKESRWKQLAETQITIKELRNYVNRLAV